MNRLHPSLVNFTAALVPVSVASDFLGRLVGAESLRQTAWWTLFYATVVTPFTAITGWLFWMPDDNGASGMTIHKWLGSALAVLLFVLFFWRWKLRRQNQLKKLRGFPGNGVTELVFAASTNRQLTREWQRPGESNERNPVKVVKKNETTRTIMKTKSKIVGKFSLGSSILALALTTWLPAYGQDQTQPMKPMKGGEHLMMLNHITATSQAEDLKPGDSIAMACAKCKSVVVETATTEKGHIKLMTPGEKHLCPGCGSTITVVGVGKGANATVKHVCEKCGGSSAFCCATTKTSPPTKGMEQK